MMDLIPDFDRKTGRQHNFHALELYLNQLTRNKNLGDDWSTYFCKLFLFDALIGNTDRHQDNWGLLWRQIEGRANARLAPAFDNGTSLGYEIMEHKMVDFKREERILQYINRGKHHIRWRLHDQKSAAHAELIRLIIQQKPFLKDTVQKLLSSFHMGKFESSLKQMTQFDIPVPLTATRAEWVYALVGARHKHLQKQLLTA